MATSPVLLNTDLSDRARVYVGRPDTGMTLRPVMAFNRPAL